MTTEEHGNLRNEGEALVRAATWLGRRAELLLANIRDKRLETIGADAAAGMLEAERIEAAFKAIAEKARARADAETVR